ncbi:6-phosphofructokinase [Ornithinimicrobium pekingense]|uniref:ATP-dependent 6-phosphofructokinase n=1 Tax=Ornithinimicrobium pekingense TaxID=384677 RepID=A0ABQ2F8H0_9MICO|nr:ATP-dependent 6-phosphofructokinase [Ornithinimicrobium pekingense]GGK72127.1 ATP-dependent 6-phosphofructokinase [Ornithinimicrobium pekingense]
MKIAVLTAGGDCPGLNAVIRGVVLKGDRIYEHEFVGVRDGFRGLVDNDIVPLPRQRVRGLSKVGGTILGTSRVSPMTNGGTDRVKEVMDQHHIDALIAVGGEGTLTVARMFHDAGIHVVGVPKTIDNDLSATDRTFGFDTAVSVATESIDRLRTTGEAHSRCMVVEVMGRNVGWIALHAGIASGAHAILIPEVPVTRQQLFDWVRHAMDRGRAPVVVVAEGFTFAGEEEKVGSDRTDGFGRQLLGGIGDQVTRMIEEATGIETRNTTLGHLQRGGVPSSYDRVLATRFGTAAVDAVSNRLWGTMVALHGINIVNVNLRDATSELKTVPREQWDEAAILFG